MFEALYRYFRLIDELSGLGDLSYRQSLILFSILLTPIILFLFINSLRQGASRGAAVARSVGVGVIAVTTLISISRTLFYYLVAGVDVGESTPDMYKILLHGHQGPSLKDGFYDILNVDAAFRALAYLIIGFDNPESMWIGLMTSSAMTVVYMILCYLLARIFDEYRAPLVLLATLLLVTSSPIVSFTLSPPTLSGVLAVLTIYLILRSLLLARDREASPTARGFITVSIVLFSTSVLAHGTAVVVLAIPVVLILLMRLMNTRGGSVGSVAAVLLGSLLATLLVITMVRFVYSSLERSAFRVYIDEIIRYFTGIGVYYRVEKWSATEIPRATSFSWALPTVLAYTPLLASLLVYTRHRRGQIGVDETVYLVLAFSAAPFVLAGFLATMFSNSLGRELYYPGYLVLYLATAYPISVFMRQKRSVSILWILTAMTVLAGISTPSWNPWLPEYRPITMAWRGPDQFHYIIAHIITDLLSPQSSIGIVSDDVLPLGVFCLLGNISCPTFITAEPAGLGGVVLVFNSESYAWIS